MLLIKIILFLCCLSYSLGKLHKLIVANSSEFPVDDESRFSISMRLSNKDNNNNNINKECLILIKDNSKNVLFREKLTLNNKTINYGKENYLEILESLRINKEILVSIIFTRKSNKKYIEIVDLDFNKNTVYQAQIELMQLPKLKLEILNSTTNADNEKMVVARCLAENGSATMLPYFDNIHQFSVLDEKYWNESADGERSIGQVVLNVTDAADDNDGMLSCSVGTRRKISTSSKIHKIRTKSTLSLEDILSGLNYKLAVLHEAMKKFQLKIFINEYILGMRLNQLNYGTFIWKISDLPTKRMEAKDPEKEMLGSNTFYTHRNGYKLKLLLFPNGQDKAKNTYMSVFFRIVKSEFDSLLTWPFPKTVRISLMEHFTGMEKIVRTFNNDNIPEDHMGTFTRPVSEYNMALGGSEFISWERLERDPLMMWNGTIIIKCSVKDN